MPTNQTITRVYREAIDSYREHGVKREEAVESALATLMVEYRAGRLKVDIEAALRAQLVRADESDGRSADGMLRRICQGNVPLIEEDFDVVVTLGKGLRKTWRFVTTEDISSMIQVRFENYKMVRESFEEFNTNAEFVLAHVERHGTIYAAYLAGAFGAKAAA